MKIAKADLSRKKDIISIAKQSPYTKGVANPMFMNDQSFERGEVAVALHRGKVYGFVVVRHLVRKPYTSLYYVGVHEDHRSKGLGERLVEWAFKSSPHEHVRLICEVENERAHEFYETLGFERTGAGENKAGEPYYVYEVTADTWKGD